MSHLYLFAYGTLGLELKHWGSRIYIRSFKRNVRLLCCIHDGPNFHGECMYGVGGSFVPDAFIFLRTEFPSYLFYSNKIVRYVPGFHLVGNRAAFIDMNTSEITRNFGILLQSNLDGKPVLLDTQESFPADEPYRITRHPEVNTIASLDGVLANVRFVTLLRSPIMSLVSQHRRFGRNERRDAALEAAVTAHELAWLQRVVEEVPSKMNLLPPYPLMKLKPEEAIRRVGIFLQCRYTLKGLKSHPISKNVILSRRWRDIQAFLPEKHYEVETARSFQSL